MGIVIKTKTIKILYVVQLANLKEFPAQEVHDCKGQISSSDGHRKHSVVVGYLQNAQQEIIWSLGSTMKGVFVFTKE